MKSFRPIASGSLPIGWRWRFLLLWGSFYSIAFYGLAAGLIIATYLSMNILYSLYIKRIAVLELHLLLWVWVAGCFGGAATDTELTAVFLRDFVLFDFLGRCKGFLSLFPTILIHDAMCLIGTPTCFFVMR